MTRREAMLAVFRGATPPGALFVPRLDIWYNRNRVRGTLPAGLESATLRDVTAELGVGLHSVVPDFIRSAPVEDVTHRALGFYNNPEFPFAFDFGAVDFETIRSDSELKVIYHTSKGDITTRCNYGVELMASGASIPDITEHAVKERDDYARVADILERVRVRPTPERYRAYRERIGDSGVAVAFASLACGPMQHIMRDLRRYEDFCLDLCDEPALLTSVTETMAPIYDAILHAAAASEAEVVLFGANYDDTITYAPFFDEHIQPWLNRAADQLHASGKLLLTHTDGENKGLLPSFEHCRFDIADSICPAPMTRVSFDEYRGFCGDRVTIWGGIPSGITLPVLCSETDFRAFVDRIMESAQPYDHLILSIADTTPPDADFARIRYIADACASTIKRRDPA